MYRPAPRCSEALSPRSMPADSISPAPPDANAASGARARASTPARSREVSLVMHGHPVGNILELAHAAPPGHRQEESEVEEREPARDPGLRRAARLHAEVAEHDEGRAE